jgi:hypothetical protein
MPLGQAAHTKARLLCQTRSEGKNEPHRVAAARLTLKIPALNLDAFAGSHTASAE